MMPAAKHGDPQLGVDIHLCIVPPSPSPVPLPTPHMSVVFDPFDYIPIIGGTITVCGMKRATAGTQAIVVHIPPGFPFAPKLPDKDDELFMGSATVVADGDPFSHIAHPVLGCQIAGMFSPPRPKKKNKNMMLLPTTFNLAIPTNVFVGGPPTISMIGMAFKGLFAGLGKFAKSGVFKRMRQKLFKNMNPGFLKCKILRAEPVNILTGEVSVEQEDFNLPGRIPIQWVRTYASGNRRAGLCGHGWETPGDARLEINGADGSVQMQYPVVGPLFFERLPAAQGNAAAVLELMDGALLSDHGHEYQVRTKEDRIYHFRKDLTAASGEVDREIPLGRVSDLCGNGLEFERHGGRLTAINESAGRRIGLHVAKDGTLEIALNDAVTDTRHVFVRYEKDAAGNLASVSDALGNPYRFAYDDHHMVRHTDRNGLSFYYEYDKQASDEWRVIHAWGDGNLYNYRFHYSDALNERRITDSLGHVSLVKLDDRGLPISEIDPLGGMTVFEYDEAGRTTAVTDPGGRRTGYEYDERGNLLTLTRPDDKTLVTEFSPADKAVGITDPNGAQWLQKWDERGLLVEQISPLGNVSRYEYDAHGQLTAFINPRGARTELAFDGAGNIAGVKDALQHTTVFAYDRLGNICAKRDPLGHNTLYFYDVKGRLTRATLPSGATIVCGYDAEDNLTCYVDENGAETRLEYYGQGEIARRMQPDGHQVEYLYDIEERLTTVKNQRGETYTLRRDALGRVVEETDYWGQSRYYTYDASGYLRTSTDPLARTIRYGTDPLGRILKKTLPDGFVEEFAYDANGNLTATKNPHIAIERKYDAEDRLTEEVQGSFVIKNSYDANGNRVIRETSIGNRVAYEYDALDEAIAIRVNQEEPMRIERDAVGKIAKEKLTSQLSRQLNYSADGYITGQAITVNSQPLFATCFEYDRAGNLTQRSDSQYGSAFFRYDPLGRITESLDPQQQVTRYLGDPAGDLLGTRIVEGVRRRVAGDDVFESEWSREGEYEGGYYRFDRAGNLVERREAHRTLNLTWSANQRLSESRSNGTKTRYGYDPLGRRIFKENPAQRKQFFWDGDALVGESILAPGFGREQLVAIGENVVSIARRDERDEVEAPNKEREFVYYPETFEPLALIDGTTSNQLIYFYHNNPNGCPTRLTTGNGRVVWAADHTAWGHTSRVQVNETDNPLRFQGQYEDSETGLFYNRYRYFDSRVGSFISQDPLKLVAGEALYALAANAFFWTDPLGLVCQETARRYKILRAKGLTPGEALAVAKGGRYTPRSRAHLSASHHHANSVPQPGKGRFNVGEGGQKFTDEIIYHPNTTFTRQTNGRMRFDNPDLGRGAVGKGTDNVTPVNGGRVVLESLSPPGYSHHGPTDVVTQFPQ